MKTAAIVCALLSLVLATCSGGDTIGSNQGGGFFGGTLNGLSAITTTDGLLGNVITVAHTDGDSMVIRTDGGGGGLIGQVTGAIFTASNGTTVAMDIGPSGLPLRGFVGNNAIVIGGFRTNSVQVGVVVGNTNPASVATASVPYDTVLFQLIQQLTGFVAPGEGPEPSLSLVTATQIAGFSLVLFGGILQNIPTSVLPTSALPAGQVFPGGQGLFTGIAALMPGDDGALQDSGGAFAMTACGTTDVSACLNMILNDPMTGANMTVMNANQTAMDLMNEINNLQGAFMGGSGDVQVTLTWDQAVDLDLMVTDPTNCTVAFFNTSCPSGGMLDIDDTNGFGPENIFWPPMMAPVGTYSVAVNYFSGNPVTNYNVLIQVEGQTMMFSGTLTSPGQTDNVATFIVTGTPMPVIAGSGEAEDDGQ